MPVACFVYSTVLMKSNFNCYCFVYCSLMRPCSVRPGWDYVNDRLVSRDQWSGKQGSMHLSGKQGSMVRQAGINGQASRDQWSGKQGSMHCQASRDQCICQASRAMMSLRVIGLPMDERFHHGRSSAVLDGLEPQEGSVRECVMIIRVQ